MSCEIQWITQILRDFKVEYKGPALAYCDNKSAIHMAENPVFHERTKHIEIDCHFIREKVKSGLIDLKYVCTDRNLANGTKGLSAHLFKWIVFKLGVYDIYSPACGGLSNSMDKAEEGEDEEELEAPVAATVKMKKRERGALLKEEKKKTQTTSYNIVNRIV
ncbi:unnamed protein product [Linum trigynum]|uniref:Copia protein n=1 Tax=Linum trigynum TaxID=586398 RepID=A0AAV2ENT0_9ROSI